MTAPALIGRRQETAWLADAAADALAGRGALVLLAGEAGVGKSHLAETAFAGLPLLRGAAHAPAAAPYGPVVAALRSRLREDPAALDACGRLRPHLALLLPELGEPDPSGDRATLFEAVHGALVAVAPAVVLLDDLQWSDGATLDLLAALAVPLREQALLVVGAYRTDEVRAPLRRLRADLRRARALRELVVRPLDAAGTRELAARTLGSPPAPALAEALYDRTQGIPFFVQELAAGLQAGERLRAGPDGLELEHDADVPIPETIRDAVLLRTMGLSGAGRAAAEAAAVVGPEFRLDLAPALDELLEAGLIVEIRPGRAAFRHALVRGAIYEDIPWRRRRDLHAGFADALEFGGASHATIAAHRLAAGDRARALDAFLAAAHDLARVHAHRDAAAAALQALELWPEGVRSGERLAALDVYARSAELAGDLAEATRALREAAALRHGAERGVTARRLAGLYELQGDRERALVARRDAVAAFDLGGRRAEAAGERLGLAAYAQSAGRHQEAVELARAAAADALAADRSDLRARAFGLEGVAQAKRGRYGEGVETIRAGLALALAHELTAEAAELYQRLATAMESAADYGGAREALTTAVGLCEATGERGQEHTCLSCMAYVLRELGDWDQAAALCKELGAGRARADDALVADGILGSILAFRGDTRHARPLLLRCRATAARLDVVSMGVDSVAALAYLDAQDPSAAVEHALAVLERWERTEDHHYAVWGLRTAAELLARHGDLPRARAAAAALSTIAAETAHADALAALAHALGEIALAEGDTQQAADKLTRALDLHADLEIPFERAQIALRAGVALARSDRREAALQRLEESYRAAKRLQAKPLATAAAQAFERLGEPLERRLGPRAAAQHASAGLTRREVEITRLVALGRTNREIARELFLSPRTVDMHVRNVLAKLGCRTRTEAANRAGQLGLLTR
ncbi:AAA family ATPase [Solirubrobacter sp. CPCC 204708]|uniref:LuxR C-terminal-related transcriptional regulator n=1 Tax=Solirubrobacter deserti TaxID=2282478 RepID=A0ABT4RCA7_9ACTN|nr:helix-turn-helix transcriptional regulator [Solirubrobacter deserti]MBE2315534.1 AAA family ATPase [Solirubrobacter deserti]MDA0136172.1 LuxR C-terminal-related transcriptional regulator [Solirubrobacter deserti]